MVRSSYEADEQGRGNGIQKLCAGNRKTEEHDNGMTGF
jgi:hypothetical protein